MQVKEEVPFVCKSKTLRTQSFANVVCCIAYKLHMRTLKFGIFGFQSKKRINSIKRVNLEKKVIFHISQKIKFYFPDMWRK